MTSPNGREVFVVGSSIELRWDASSPTDAVDLTYSTDAGTTWLPVASSVTGGRYLWKVPKTPSDRCLLKVTQAGSKIVRDAMKLPTRWGEQYVLSAQFSRDGKAILVHSFDDTKLWNSSTGLELFEFPSKTRTLLSEVYSPVFSPSGLLIAVNGDSAVVLYDYLTGVKVHQFPLPTAHGIRFSRDGSLIAGAGGNLQHGEDRTVRIWKVQDGAPVCTIVDNEQYHVWVAAISPDDQRVITCGDSTKIWDVATGTLIKALTKGTANAEYSADGGHILTNGVDTVSIWYSDGRQAYYLDNPGYRCYHAEYSPDGRYVLVAWTDNTTRIYDASDGTPLHILRGGHGPIDAGADWTLGWGTYSDDGSRVLTASGDSTARIWDAQSGRLLASLVGHANVVLHGTFSPDGQRVATAAYDGTARVWDLGPLTSEEDVSDSLWSIVAPEISAPRSVSMPSLTCNSWEDSTIVLSNPGVSPLMITRTEISGTDASSFLLPSFSLPHVIAPGEKDTVAVRFFPSGSGDKTATLHLYSNAIDLVDSVASIALAGHKDSVGFKFSRQFMDFGYVALNALAEDTVSLTNTGTLPLSWNAPLSLTPFTIVSVEPPVTQPGGRSILNVRFDGSPIRGQYMTRYDARDAICGHLKSLDLTARVVTAAVKLEVPDLYAAPGEIVEVPVKVKEAIGLSTVKSSELRSELSFDRTLLIPLAPTPAGRIDSTQRRIPFMASASLTADSTLYRFRFRAALGSDTVTSLKLSEFTAIGDSIVVASIAGRFHLIGICQSGGSRLIAEGAATALKPTIPDPSRGITEINFDLAESGRTVLQLTDMLGRTVNVLLDEVMEPGAHSALFDASTLPAGLYICMLVTPTERSSEMISIVR